MKYTIVVDKETDALLLAECLETTWIWLFPGDVVKSEENQSDYVVVGREFHIDDNRLVVYCRKVTP